jgi:hypothetical protein
MSMMKLKIFLRAAFIVVLVSVKGDLANPSHSTTAVVVSKPKPAGGSGSYYFDSGTNFSGAIRLNIVHGKNYWYSNEPHVIKRVFMGFNDKSFGQDPEAVYNGHKTSFPQIDDITSSIQLVPDQIEKIIVWADDKFVTAIQIQSVSGATSQMFGVPAVGSKPTEFQGGRSSLLVGFYGTFDLYDLNSLGFSFAHTES